MISRPTMRYAWKEVGDLDFNKPDSNSPIFADASGRNFVLCQVMENDDGTQALREIEIKE